MAVVQRNAQTNSTVDGKGKTQDKLVEVDLSKLLATKELGVKRDLDATEDAWERSAPILPGRYPIKAYMSKDKPKMGYYDEAKKEPWFTLALECKVQSDDVDIKNTTIFGGVTTRINARKNISTAAGLIVKYGFKIPAQASDLEIVKMVDLVLKKERVIDVQIDWKAGYSEADGSWINLANTYDDFPDNPDGGKDFVIKVEKKDGSKEEVRARLYISHWYSKDEPTIKGGDGSTTSQAAGKVPASSAPPQLAEEEQPMIPGLVANTVPAKPSAAPKAEISDDEALKALLED